MVAKGHHFPNVTLTGVISADARHLLVHCLDTDDPDGVRDEIKKRYERRLMEIFQ